MNLYLFKPLNSIFLRIKSVPGDFFKRVSSTTSTEFQSTINVPITMNAA